MILVDQGRLIDEPRFKPLVEAVEKMVRDDGIREEFILASQSKDSVMVDAIREIVSNVAEFDFWYFEPEMNGFLNEQQERLKSLSNETTGSEELAAIVRQNVETTLGFMREAEELPVEPDVPALVDQLVSYIVNWQDWYYDYKSLRDRLDWSEMIGENSDIYLGDYGDGDSMGSSLQYEDEE